MLKLFTVRLKPYARAIALSLILLAADVAIQSVFPLLMGKIVDQGIRLGDGEVIGQTGGMMLFLTLLSCGIGLWLCYLSITITQKCIHQIRKDVHHHALSMSVSQLESMSSGELLTRVIGDTQVVMQLFGQSLMMLCRPLLLIVTGTVLLIVIHPQFSVVFVVLVPIQALTMYLFIFRMSPVFKRIQTHVEGMNSTMQEALSAIRTVKAYNGEETEDQRFKRYNARLFQDSMHIQQSVAVLNPCMMLLMNAGILLLLWVCSQLTLDGQLNAGGVMAALSYVQQVLMAVLLLGQFFPNVSRAKVSIKRLTEFFAVQNDLPDGNRELETEKLDFVLDGVSFAYPGQKTPSLEKINIEIPQGAYWGIIGPVGCGKSTLVALLPRFFDPSTGSITLNHEPIESFTLQSLRKRVILVVQKSAFSSDTVADNIRYGLNATLEEVERAGKIAQIDSYIRSLPLGYQTPMNENGLSFSGGQRQCLAIARALLRKPSVLILDDSTSSVDLSTEMRLHRALRAANPGMTMIVIGQRIAALAGAERILVLERGHVEGIGRHTELMETCGLYRTMCRTQDIEAEV